MNRKKILWVIAARSGSKSIPHKNIKFLAGYPLISYRIISALNTNIEKDVWVSTDSLEYAKISEEFGAEIPFIRPDFLAMDDSSSIDVVLHSMDFAIKNNKHYDYVGLLEPTSPFITSEQLDKALNYLELNKDASAVVATRENRPNKLFIQKESQFLNELADNLKSLKKVGRQSFDKEITPSGGFYISKWSDFLELKSFYSEKTLSFLVDDISGLEIDEPLDWNFAEFIIDKNIFDIEKIFK